MRACVFKGCTHNSNRRRACSGSALVESFHSYVEAGSFGADNIFGRNSDIMEYYIRGVGKADPHLVLMLSHVHARRIAVYHKHGESPRPPAFVRGGKHGINVGELPVRYKAFVPI